MKTAIAYYSQHHGNTKKNAPRKNYFDDIHQVAKDKQCRELGKHLCLGFDTFGPLKLIGGIQKGHPTEEEVQATVAFYRGLAK